MDSATSRLRHHPLREVAAAVLAAACLVGALAPAAAAEGSPAADSLATQQPSSADAPDNTASTGTTYEATALPATLSVDGHGWGHGRGMGQYGSLGYATGITGEKWSYSRILDHFYGGGSAGVTKVGHIGNPLMSVLIKARPAGSAMVVYRSTGLQIQGQTDTPPAVRVTPLGGNKYNLQTGTTCSGPWSTNDRIVDGPVRVTKMEGSGDRALRLCYGSGASVCDRSDSRCEIAYDDSTELVAIGDRTVNLVRMEEMLRGIVPRESPASWGDSGGGSGINALRAQAVAARSYAAAGDTRWGDLHTPLGANATTCDDTYCQVYGGVAYVNASGGVTNRTQTNTDRAIDDTQNEVRVMSATGRTARTEFSSSTGGYTVGPTFPAVPDQGDAVSSNPYHHWSSSLSRTSIEAKYGTGTLTDVRFERNGLGDMGGRVRSVQFVGTSKTVTKTGNEVRRDFGLRSDWFNVSVPPPPVREPRSIDTACPSGMPTGAFSDVASSSPHARAVDCVAWRKIAQGNGDGTFSPAADVTRAQMASFVARLIEVSGGKQLPTSFPDAFDDDNGLVHELNINRLAAAGIVNGVSPRRYQPNQPIDRAQLASILARAIKFIGVPLSATPPNAFSDDNGSVHETSINQLAAEGVVAGTGPGTYSPKASAHRDQMASMLARALDLALSS